MRMLRSALALILVLSPSLVSSSSAEEISLRNAGGVYTVPVEINGTITLDFVLDSGASDVSIPADVMLTLTRTGTVTSADFLQPTTYTLADGSSISSPRFVVHRMKLGSLELEDVVASVAPTQGVLLLGQSFLSKIASWRVDNSRHLLILNETEGNPENGQNTSIENGDVVTGTKLNERGLGLARLGDHEGAILQFTQAIGITSDDARVFNNRANSYVQIGNLQKAISDYSRAIELQPVDAAAYFGRGLAHSFAGSYFQALSDYGQAIALKPNDADYAYQRGITLANKMIGQYDRAIADYNKAIKLRPNFALAFFSRGAAHSQMGHVDLAKADYLRAIELDPDKFSYNIECLVREASFRDVNDAMLNCSSKTD
jgi:Flp pilus assembly protein TadD